MAEQDPGIEEALVKAYRKNYSESTKGRDDDCVLQMIRNLTSHCFNTLCQNAGIPDSEARLWQEQQFDVPVSA